jgi:hypothetical protein
MQSSACKVPKVGDTIVGGGVVTSSSTTTRNAIDGHAVLHRDGTAGWPPGACREGVLLLPLKETKEPGGNA